MPSIASNLESSASEAFSVLIFSSRLCILLRIFCACLVAKGQHCGSGAKRGGRRAARSRAHCAERTRTYPQSWEVEGSTVAMATLRDRRRSLARSEGSGGSKWWFERSSAHDARGRDPVVARASRRATVSTHTLECAECSGSDDPYPGLSADGNDAQRSRLARIEGLGRQGTHWGRFRRADPGVGEMRTKVLCARGTRSLTRQTGL